VNPLIFLGVLGALYYALSGDFDHEQKSTDENRSGDGNNSGSELPATPSTVDSGKGGVTSDPTEPTTQE
jgi:hypothetical protein